MRKPTEPQKLILKAIEAKIAQLGPEAEPIVKALGVLMLDHNLRSLIARTDPKAENQALRALGVIG